jgi:hypothetical protein
MKWKDIAKKVARLIAFRLYLKRLIAYDGIFKIQFRPNFGVDKF